MAMTTCAECGAAISTLASTCPKCGAPFIQQSHAPATPATPTKLSWIHKIGGGFLIAAVGTVIAVMLIQGPAPKGDPKPPQKAEAKPAPPPEPSPEEKAKAAKEQLLAERLITSASYIKGRLREPESLKWSRVLANDNGSTICFGYRAKNGFGGYEISQAVVVDGKISHEIGNVKKYCSSPAGLSDMTSFIEMMLR